MGRITGVSTAMEYSADGTNWTACAGTAVTGLSAGAYHVRYQAVTGTSFAGVAADVTVTAAACAGTGVTSPSYSASVSEIDASGKALKTALGITVSQSQKTASVKAGLEQSNIIMAGGTVVVTIPTIPNVTAYTIALPAESLSSAGKVGGLTLQTDAGSVALPANMLTGIAGTAGKNAELSIAAADKSALPESVKAAVGTRPLIQLTLSIDGKQTEWSNPGTPVTVSIPYTPTADELAHPEKHPHLVSGRQRQSGLRSKRSL